MANMKNLKVADDLCDFYNSLTDNLSDLHGALENEDEDMIRTVFDNMPSPKALATAASKLTKLLSDRPRRRSKKEAADG